jgi:hypothetical protein
MNDPRNPEPKLPPGAVRVGNTVGYPDQQGVIHSTPGGAIESNQGSEGGMSRGASGGCPQDSDNVPYTPWGNRD